MSPEPQTTKAHETNIDTVVRLESEDEKRLSRIDRISGAIGGFAGSNLFILLQLALVATWLSINTGALSTIPKFDPHPFSLLSLVLSLEGVLLMAFVLIRQNQMSLRADRRSHLDLQINLLTEKEVTKVLQLLQGLSRQVGVDGGLIDAETKELGKDTAVEGLAKDLRKNLEKDSGTNT